MEISLSAVVMEGSDKKPRMDPGHFLEMVSEIGYHGVCMRASIAGTHADRAERIEVRRHMDRLGLRATMVTANFDVPLNNAQGPLALRKIGPHLDVADDFRLQAGAGLHSELVRPEVGAAGGGRGAGEGHHP